MKYYIKDVDNYEIVINNDVNMVNVIASSEDAKSKVKVYGNDNLKENDYKVLVKVTSESGNAKTYIIKFKIDNSDNVIAPLEENTKEEINTEEKKQNQDSKSKIIKIGIIALIILILSIIISRIIYNKILDSKIVI